MLVLGFQGSPRTGGNTDILLSTFLDEASRLGAETVKIEPAKMKISPCVECRTCEKKGYCRIDDYMQEIYHLLRKADVVALASPIFFYGVSAFMKAVIDRTQALWARRYVYKLDDPRSRVRKGFFISLGATKGKNLFEGVKNTAKYFFDAIGASFEGSLTYRKIEKVGDIKRHPTAISDAKEKAREILLPLLKRKKFLYICRENACRSQMAWAFTTYLAGDEIEALSAGSEPKDRVDEVMVKAMEEKGIDMSYLRPRSLKEIPLSEKVDMIVTLGCKDACPVVPGAETADWNLPDPSGREIDFMRKVRDEIEEKVKGVIEKYI